MRNGESVGLAVVACFMVGAVIFAMLNSAAIPDVHVSYSTNECVKVLNYVEGDNYSCENMPSKFNHVWVQ